jgi:hypothetical protein
MEAAQEVATQTKIEKKKLVTGKQKSSRDIVGGAEAVPNFFPDGPWDCMDRMALGDPEIPELPTEFTKKQTLLGFVLKSKIREKILSGLRKPGDNTPDEELLHRKIEDRPEPFSPKLLPGLCAGFGGLFHSETPVTEARNKILADVLNRLSGNAYVYAGYCAGYPPLPLPSILLLFSPVPPFLFLFPSLSPFP